MKYDVQNKSFEIRNKIFFQRYIYKENSMKYDHINKVNGLNFFQLKKHDIKFYYKCTTI